MTERTLQHCWVAAVICAEAGNIPGCAVDNQAWDLPSGQDVCSGVRRVVADTVTMGVSVGWMAGIHSHVRDGVTLVFPGAA